MKLDVLHVAKRNYAGIQSDGRTHSFIDRSVGGVLPVDATITASCNHGGLCQNCRIASGSQATNHGANAAAAVVN